MLVRHLEVISCRCALFSQLELVFNWANFSGREVIPRGCQAPYKALVWALPASSTSTIASTPPRTLSGSHLGMSFTYWRWASSWELALHGRFVESGSIGPSFRLCLNSRQSSPGWEEAVHSCMPGLYSNSLVTLFFPVDLYSELCRNSGRSVHISGRTVYETDPRNHCHGLHIQVLHQKFRNSIYIFLYRDIQAKLERISS